MKKKVKATKPAVYTTGEGTVYSVREAKAQLSALVGRAAKGEEITITWHGHSRARIAPLAPEGGALRINRDWLKTQPLRPQGARAEGLVRSDRDAKG